jgi:hypothetical protein
VLHLNKMEESKNNVINIEKTNFLFSQEHCFTQEESEKEGTCSMFTNEIWEALKKAAYTANYNNKIMEIDRKTEVIKIKNSK